MITEAIDLEPDLDQSTARNREGRLAVACLFIYLILSISVFWPASPWNATRLPSTPFGGYGFGDPVGLTWALSWFTFALEHGLNIFHTSYLDYPGGANVINGAPLLGLLAAPITLTLGPFAAFNVLLRIAFASSAGSMFLVLRNWCRWPAAFVGGLLYGFGPYMTSQGQTHLNLIFIPIPPVIVWCLYELLVSRRRNPLRMGALLGALAGAQALIEPELITMLGVVVAIGLVGVAVRSGREWRERLGHVARSILPAAAVFVVMTGYMIWSLVFAPGHLVGTIQAVPTLQQYRADLLGPIVPTINQLILPTSFVATAARYVAGNFSENSTYLGLPAVILLAVFGVKWRRQPLVAVSALLALVAFVLSLGSRLTINAHVTSIPLPEAVFTRIPLLDDTVPVRFSFVVTLFAMIALAVGADLYLREMATRGASRRGHTVTNALGIVTLVLCVVLLLPQVPFTTKAPSWPQDVDSLLKVIPRGAAVLAYPFPDDPFTEAMSWQVADGMRFKLFGGYAVVQGMPNSGTVRPPLLNPPLVQEYFMQAQTGDPPMPSSSATESSARHALCAFISEHDVGAVVFWDAGVYPRVIRELLLADLGSPTRSTRDGKVLLWLTAPNRCNA